MCTCAPVLPQTGGTGPAQATPMAHKSANRARNALRIGLPGSCWLIYAAFLELEPLATVPGPTLAENRPKTDQH